MSKHQDKHYENIVDMFVEGKNRDRDMIDLLLAQPNNNITSNLTLAKITEMMEFWKDSEILGDQTISNTVINIDNAGK